MARLREQPGVTAVTFSSAVPGFGPDRRIEFPGTGAVDDRAPQLDASDTGLRPGEAFRGNATAARRRLRRSRSMSTCSRPTARGSLAGRDFDGRDTGLVHRGHREPHVRDRMCSASPRTRRSGRASAIPRRRTGSKSSGSWTTFPVSLDRPALRNRADGVPTGRSRGFPSGRRVDAFRRSDSRGNFGAPARSWRADRSGDAAAARGSAVGLLRRAPLRLADDRPGRRASSRSPSCCSRQPACTR